MAAAYFGHHPRWAIETIRRLLGETAFRRGEANGDGGIDIADGISILAYLFDSGPAPSCLRAADVDDGGEIDIADPVYLLGYLFAEGPAPAPPFPGCGTDATADGLGCASYPACE